MKYKSACILCYLIKEIHKEKSTNFILSLNINVPYSHNNIGCQIDLNTKNCNKTTTMSNNEIFYLTFNLFIETSN